MAQAPPRGAQSGEKGRPNEIVHSKWEERGVRAALNPMVGMVGSAQGGGSRKFSLRK